MHRAVVSPVPERVHVRSISTPASGCSCVTGVDHSLTLA